MRVIDFATCYVTVFTRDPNIARFELDSACEITDEDSGKRESFYLLAPCRAERMYRKTPLFIMPNYEFAGIWSADECLMIRTHWTSERSTRQYAVNQEEWADVRLDIRHLDKARKLDRPDELVKATLDNLPLVGRTELHDESRGVRALLEYPIKIMNVLECPDKWQVDTGPLIVPDFDSPAPRLIERFDVAHVVYNALEKAEFILRRPVPIPEGSNSASSVSDYSVIRVSSARNEIFCPEV